jgi:hypothetical protein
MTANKPATSTATDATATAITDRGLRAGGAVGGGGSV